MDNNENPNLKAFADDFRRIIGKLQLEAGEVVYLTDDNSFPEFLVAFCNSIGADIEDAIKEESPKSRQPGRIESDFERYTYSIIENVGIKFINENLRGALTDVNILLTNWLRLVQESDLYDTYYIDQKSVESKLKLVTDINAIMSGTNNLEKLIWMTGNLLTKAKQVLSSTPPSFNISEHYANAISKAIED